MDDDSEKSKTDDGRPDDMLSLLCGIGKNINFKMVIVLFFIFIILCSDIFFSSVLEKISGATEGSDVSTKGVVIQALFLCISYILSDLFIQHNLI